ncbi:MAG: hypothetical protein KME20_05445 [Kaiparowitsia implicata GSE-PSE-MK54-09C]|jgi:hypothetical protein|nr:hypothetical protein [Kaiparowitsia implicata GSE-PSE-MK54-09C]
MSVDQTTGEGNILSLQLVDGYVQNPVYQEGQKRPWAALVCRTWSIDETTKAAFLARDRDGREFDVSGLVVGSCISIGAQVEDANTNAWQKVERYFSVVGIDDQELKLREISVREVPTLAQLDPTAHPGILALRQEVVHVREYLGRIERMLHELEGRLIGRGKAAGE